ncbi:MAG TPA: hypothetical protein VGM24_04260, partial [Puia sp.]
MKNSSQRKICFLVVLLGLGFFISASGQGTAKPLWVRDFSSLPFPGEMLKNKNPHFTPDSAFYPVSAYDL